MFSPAFRIFLCNLKLLSRVVYNIIYTLIRINNIYCFFKLIKKNYVFSYELTYVKIIALRYLIINIHWYLMNVRCYLNLLFSER